VENFLALIFFTGKNILALSDYRQENLAPSLRKIIWLSDEQTNASYFFFVFRPLSLSVDLFSLL